MEYQLAAHNNVPLKDQLKLRSLKFFNNSANYWQLHLPRAAMSVSSSSTLSSAIPIYCCHSACSTVAIIADAAVVVNTHLCTGVRVCAIDIAAAYQWRCRQWHCLFISMFCFRPSAICLSNVLLLNAIRTHSHSAVDNNSIIRAFKHSVNHHSTAHTLS